MSVPARESRNKTNLRQMPEEKLVHLSEAWFVCVGTLCPFIPKVTPPAVFPIFGNFFLNIAVFVHDD